MEINRINSSQSIGPQGTAPTDDMIIANFVAEFSIFYGNTQMGTYGNQTCGSQIAGLIAMLQQIPSSDTANYAKAQALIKDLSNVTDPADPAIESAYPLVIKLLQGDPGAMAILNQSPGAAADVAFGQLMYAQILIAGANPTPQDFADALQAFQNAQAWLKPYFALNPPSPTLTQQLQLALSALQGNQNNQACMALTLAMEAFGSNFVHT